MTVPERVLFRIIQLLEGNGIPYMVSGSLACTAYGDARTSNDIDIVIDPSKKQLEALVEAVEPGYYVSREGVMSALEQRGMFNIIDRDEMLKIDFIIRKTRPFSLEEFARKSRRTVGGVTMSLLSPEDSILSKLEWCKGRGYDNQQVKDAAGMVAVQKERLDLVYLRKWAKELGIEEVLEAVLKAGGM